MLYGGFLFALSHWSVCESRVDDERWPKTEPSLFQYQDVTDAPRTSPLDSAVSEAFNVLTVTRGVRLLSDFAIKNSYPLATLPGSIATAISINQLKENKLKFLERIVQRVEELSIPGFIPSTCFVSAAVISSIARFILPGRFPQYIDLCLWPRVRYDNTPICKNR